MKASGVIVCMIGFCLATDAALIVPGEPMGVGRIISVAVGLVLFAVGTVLCLSGPTPRHH